MRSTTPVVSENSHMCVWEVSKRSEGGGGSTRGRTARHT